MAIVPKQQKIARLQGMLIGFTASLLLTGSIAPLTHVGGRNDRRLKLLEYLLMPSISRYVWSLLGSIRYPQAVSHRDTRLAARTKRSPAHFSLSIERLTIAPVLFRLAFRAIGNRGGYLT